MADLSLYSDLPVGADIGRFSMVLDTETTGLDVLTDRPFLVGFTIDEREYAFEWTEAMPEILSYWLLRADRVGMFNGKFDLHMLMNGGIGRDVIPLVRVWDAQVAQQLIDEHLHEYTLDSVAKGYGINYDAAEFHKEIARALGCRPDRDAMRYMGKMPREFAARKCLADVRATQYVIQKQLPVLEQQELMRVFTLEMQVLPILALMEKEGVPVDMDALDRAQGELRTLVDQLDEEITQMVGYRVNVNSQKDMQYAFRVLGIPEDPDGSFGRPVLDSIAHPFGRLALEMRTVLKVKDTFVEGNRPHVRADGRIHTTFHQLRGDEYGTHTGRLSTSNPNMQQIPKRDARAAGIIRRVFAHHDFAWVRGDWGQFEFRIATHYWHDENLIGAYLADPGADFHQMVAELAGIRRDPDAKRINLGLVFGMGEGKMAYMLGLGVQTLRGGHKVRYVPGPEAKALFARYHTRFPKIREFLGRAQDAAREKGYVRSILGRRLRFPGGAGANKAGGLVFQASAADIMKLTLVALWGWQRWGTKVILPVHDEFNVLSPRAMAQDVAHGVRTIMENAYPLMVPIVAKVSYGDNWWEASV